MNRKGFLSIPVLILIALVTIGVIVVVIHYRHTFNQVQAPIQSPSTSSTPTTSPATTTPTSTLLIATTTLVATTTAMLPPSCTFLADPLHAIAPQPVELIWTCKDATTCSITSDHGDDFSNQNPQQGTLGVQPNFATVSYTLHCANEQGKESSNTVNVTVSASSPQYFYSP